MAKVPQETAEIIPVVEERAIVRKRKRITGAVQVRTKVNKREHVVDEPVVAEEISVERVPVDRWVDAPLAVRQEGDTTVIPLHEEVMLVETRLKVTEEVRITRRRSTLRARERVTLRHEEAIIDRLAVPAVDDQPA